MEADRRRPHPGRFEITDRDFKVAYSAAVSWNMKSSGKIDASSITRWPRIRWIDPLYGHAHHMSGASSTWVSSRRYAQSTPMEASANASPPHATNPGARPV